MGKSGAFHEFQIRLFSFNAQTEKLILFPETINSQKPDNNHTLTIKDNKTHNNKSISIIYRILAEFKFYASN